MTMKACTKLDKLRTALLKMNADVSADILANKLSDKDMEVIDEMILVNMQELKELREKLDIGKRLNKKRPNKKLSKVEKVLYKLQEGFTSAPYITEEFSDFKRMFKSMMKSELEKVNATNFTMQKNTHFYVGGFFTIGNQPYYYALSDVRWEPTFYIRTVVDYNDYTGGNNRYLKLKEDMFKEFFNV